MNRHPIIINIFSFKFIGSLIHITNLHQYLKGRQAWAQSWQSQADIFEKLYRTGLCESMHKQPLLDGEFDSDGRYRKRNINRQRLVGLQIRNR